MLPGKVVETDYAYPQVTTPVSTVTLMDLHYIDGDPANTPKSYYIVFPAGSVVMVPGKGTQRYFTFHIVTRPRRLTDKALAKLELENNLRRQQAQPWRR